MKFLTALAPRDAVLDGTADFVVNLAGLGFESQGVFKLGAFQDLGRAYGLSDYEELVVF